MLKYLLSHKDTFTSFIIAKYPRIKGELLLLTDEDWCKAGKLLSFFELFYDSRVTLSGIYYPMLHS